MPLRGWIVYFAVLAAVLIVVPKSWPVVLTLAGIIAIVLIAPSS
jgi:hypothetical protein